MAVLRPGREDHLLRCIRPRGKSYGSTTNGVAFGTRPGKARITNQDRVLHAQFSDHRGENVDLSVLCDGMGGMVDGERCAELGATTFLLTLARDPRLLERPLTALGIAADMANRRVHRELQGRGGTTLAAILAYRGSVFVCCVGDSRIFGSGAGGLRQLSRDDTVRGALDAAGMHRPEGANRVPEHERLVQFLGMGQDLEPQVFTVEPARQYRFIMACSDGAYRPPGAGLALLAENAPNARALVERILAFSEWLGGPDDASLVVMDLSTNEVRESLPQDDVMVWGPSMAMLVVEARDSGVPVREHFIREQVDRGPLPALPPARAPKPTATSQKKKRGRQQHLPLPAARDSVVIEAGAPTKQSDTVFEQPEAAPDADDAIE